MQDTYAIVAAAGQSTRFKQSSNGSKSSSKVFELIDGKPVWQYSIETFRKVARIDAIVLTLDAAIVADFIAEHETYLAKQNVHAIAGGDERWASVQNAIAFLQPRIDGKPSSPIKARTLVAIHDAARPCVSLRSVNSVIELASIHGAAILGTHIWGTIKRVNSNDFITETVPRENLYQAATPQVFDWQWLQQVYALDALESVKAQQSITDDAQLITAAGHAVRVCHDDATNIKITTAGDLELVKLWLRTQN